MDITPLISSDRQVIQSYSAGRFKISGKIFDHPVIVFPDRVEPWSVADIQNIVETDFDAVLPYKKDLDVVLVGCGVAFSAPLFKLRMQLKTKGLAIDVMDTGAACRTYNVLMAEGRRVAALLLPA